MSPAVDIPEFPSLHLEFGGIHLSGAGSTLQEQDPFPRSRIHPPGAESIPISRIPTPTPPPGLPLSVAPILHPGNYSAVSQLFPGAAGMRRQQRYYSQGGFFPVFYGWDKLLPRRWNSCGPGEARAGRGSAESWGSRCFFVIPAPGVPPGTGGLTARLFQTSLLGRVGLGKTRENGTDPFRLRSQQILALPGHCWFSCWVFPRLMDHLLPSLLPSLSFISRDFLKSCGFVLMGFPGFPVAEATPAIAAEQIPQLPEPRCGFS